MIVCKFGGSSLADGSQIKKVQRIVQADSKRRIVVVSAPGKRSADDDKVTDLLYACNQAVEEGGSCKTIFDVVRERFLSIAGDLGMDAAHFEPILEGVFQGIEEGRGAHWAASRGEYLSAQLISAYFGWEFLEVEGRIIIASDGSVEQRSYALLSDAIEENKNYIVPGFYGSTAEGTIRTFSRGGSDITGAIISRSCNASVYENWTDVSGIYSVDPRLVPEAKVVQQMTYREIRELSGVGASVFHEEAIAPVIAAGIPINVKNTNAPFDEGSWIVPARDAQDTPLVGVAAKVGYSRLVIKKLMLFKQTGIQHALLTMLHVFGIRPSFSLLGIDSIVWFFESDQASASVVEAMKTRLTEEFSLESVTVEDNHAIAGVVGAGVTAKPAYVATIANTLEEAGIDLNFLSYGGSDTSILFGVGSDEAKQAVTLLYTALFE